MEILILYEILKEILLKLNSITTINFMKPINIWIYVMTPGIYLLVFSMTYENSQQIQIKF